VQFKVPPGFAFVLKPDDRILLGSDESPLVVLQEFVETPLSIEEALSKDFTLKKYTEQSRLQAQGEVGLLGKEVLAQQPPLQRPQLVSGAGLQQGLRRSPPQSQGLRSDVELKRDGEGGGVEMPQQQVQMQQPRQQLPRRELESHDRAQLARNGGLVRVSRVDGPNSVGTSARPMATPRVRPTPLAGKGKGGVGRGSRGGSG
jgi:hypothetical protein